MARRPQVQRIGGEVGSWLMISVAASICRKWVGRRGRLPFNDLASKKSSTSEAVGS